jgi:hypothetical protein
LRNHINQLQDLHQELLAALDAGDVERVAELVGRREAVVDRLREEFATADPQERAALQPDLAALLPLDRDLHSRAAALRDQLRDDLDRHRDHQPGQAGRPTITGILDRQA